MPSTSAEELVHAAIDEVNSSFDKLNLSKSRETQLVGEQGGIDSLAVVSLVIALETRITAHTGKTLSLVNEDFFESEGRPLRTVGTLIEYTETILKR
jgi:acyl carrier protein